MRHGLLLLTVLCQAPSGERQTAPAASAPASRPDAWAERLPKLVAGLGSPEWSVRQAATEELFEVGEPAYAALKAEFRRTRNYEVKRRIHNIVEQVFFYRATANRGGFLGISHQPVDRNAAAQFPTAGVIPEGELWIHVQSVMAGSAAERAGLRFGDLIDEVNGQRLRANGPQAFADWIGSQPPGTQVQLGVVRNWKQIYVQAVLGRRTMADTINRRQPREQNMLKAADRFASWWRREFDPQGEVEESTPAASDPNWKLGN